jgi:hypothetical protein
VVAVVVAAAAVVVAAAAAVVVQQSEPTNQHGAIQTKYETRRAMSALTWRDVTCAHHTEAAMWNESGFKAEERGDGRCRPR